MLHCSYELSDQDFLILTAYEISVRSDDVAIPRDYTAYEGAWAVEVYNHGCAVLSGMNDAERVFEDILRTGKRIFAVATDDNHNSFPLDSWQCDSFGGFTMIKAENLDYSTVIDAMERGHFYASTGPLIEELYYEDGKIYLRCSEAAEVCMNSLGRWGRRVAGSTGELITEAVFDLEKDLFDRPQDVGCWGVCAVSGDRSERKTCLYQRLLCG